MVFVILAFDGLDYRCAIKFPTLKQAECGLVDTTDVGDSTPVVWASFLTGLKPTEHKVTVGYIRQVKVWNAKLNPNIRSLTHVDNSLFLWVPAYNPHPHYWRKDYTDLLQAIWKGEGNVTFYIHKLNQLFNSQQKEFKKRFSRYYNLVMAHFNYLDAIGHALKNPKRMMFYTAIVSSFVSDVKTLLKNGDVLLIISDHGTDHTPYAFYSCNEKLGLNNPHICDFYNVIISKLSQSFP